MLEDAGLARLDLAAIFAAHKNPHPKLKDLKVSKATGKRTSAASEAIAFIRKPFAAIVPDDFTDYIDDRRQSVDKTRPLTIGASVCFEKSSLP
jgi:hypothetical protein